MERGKGDVLQSRLLSLFLKKGIWVPCAPTKTTFYAWEATWGKVLALDRGGGDSSLKDSIFVVAQKSRFTISCFIVLSLAPCGKSFSP